MQTDLKEFDTIVIFGVDEMVRSTSSGNGKSANLEVFFLKKLFALLIVNNILVNVSLWPRISVEF